MEYSANKQKMQDDIERSYSKYISNTKAIMNFISSVDDELDNKLKRKFSDKNINEKLHIDEVIQMAFSIVIIYLKDNERLEKFSSIIESDSNEITESSKLEIANKMLSILTNDQDFNLTINEEGTVSIKPLANSNLKKRKIANAVDNSFEKLFKQDKDKEILYQSTYINFANNIEILISDLIYILIKRNPNIINSDKKENDKGKVGYNDLEKFDNIEDVKEEIINNYVTSKMFGSIKELIEFIREITNNNKQAFRKYVSDDDFNYIKDFYQYRHILIHNEGRINNIFLKNVSEETRKKHFNNEKIQLSYDIIETTQEKLFIIMTKLVYYIWESIYSRDVKRRYNLIQKTGYKFLTDKQYLIAQEIYSLLLSEKEKLELSQKLLCEINYAQTYKWMNDNEKSLELLESYDFSMATSDFLFSKSLLEEKFDDSNHYLKKIIAENHDEEYFHVDEIVYQYGMWPLAQDYIQTEEFKKLLLEFDLEDNIFEPYHFD